MGLFHKLVVGLKRRFNSSSMDYLSEEKIYGNDGEDNVKDALIRALSDCEIKNNVIVNTSDRNCEIDLLLRYKSKLFIIEVKHWKDSISEHSGVIIQEKVDKWTDDVYKKEPDSPFAQVKRQINLLKQSTNTSPYINGIVFFADAEVVNLSNEHVWFSDVFDMIDYIKTSGHISNFYEVSNCFNKAIESDYLFSNTFFGEKSLHCIIDEKSLIFNIRDKRITKEDIKEINIDHFFSYDSVIITLKNGEKTTTELENHEIVVLENNLKNKYSFSKIQKIILGNNNYNTFK